MDTEKLFRIIRNILDDESRLSIQTTIDQIRASIAQNNSDGFSTSQATVKTLVDNLRDKSISYSFSGTEWAILNNLGGNDYFGKGFIIKINNIIKSPSYEMLAKIDEFINKRNEFIAKVNRLNSSLDEMGIKEYKADAYEVGIILPAEQGDASLVSKKIREFELLIKDIQELVGSEKKEVKITRVSNGSLEFFTSQPVEVVLIITSILGNISTIWDKINSLKKKQQETTDDKSFSDEAKKEIRKIIDKEIDAVKKEIEDDLPEKILEKANVSLDKERKNEIRNSIRARIKIIFKWLEVDIELDVVPIRISDIEVTSEDKQVHENALKTIKETNRNLGRIYSLSPEVKKLPFKIKDEDSDED